MERNDSYLHQRNVSGFQGVWYYDGDLSANCYQRASGNVLGTVMDYGTFSCSTDEDSTYYADSAMHPGLSIRIFEFDEGVLLWNEDVYYRMK